MVLFGVLGKKYSSFSRYQFSCHLCGQKFTQRGGLDNHLMLHAGMMDARDWSQIILNIVAGVKPYKCDFNSCSMVTGCPPLIQGIAKLLSEENAVIQSWNTTAYIVSPLQKKLAKHIILSRRLPQTRLSRRIRWFIQERNLFRFVPDVMYVEMMRFCFPWLLFSYYLV